MDKVWEEIQENNRKLENCDQHDFYKAEKGIRYYCRNCGGWTNISGAYWYAQGLKHGKGDMSENLPRQSD